MTQDNSSAWTQDNPSAWRYSTLLGISSKQEREALHELIDAAINFRMSFRVTYIHPVQHGVLFIASIASTEEEVRRELALSKEVA